jgi:hypothetical protein
MPSVNIFSASILPLKKYMTADSYSDFLEKLRDALENKQKQSVDYLLEYAFSGALAQDEVDALEDIISEATLYLEL